jgi:hypothetical protein
MLSRLRLKHTVTATALLTFVVAYAGDASAASFNFSQSTGFVLGSATTESGFPVAGQPQTAVSGVEFFKAAVNPDPALHPGNNAPPPNTFASIGWGCNLGGGSCAAPGNSETAVDPSTNAARSSLSLQGKAGVIHDDGVFVTISHLEHHNQAITGQTLKDVLISSILRIGTTPVTTDADDLLITFKETPNQAPCGSSNTGPTPCEDFFTFDFSSFDPLVITDNGDKYLVSFQLANFVNSFFDPTTGTVFTGENTTSAVDVQMAITKLIPEPETLVLLGVGLMAVWVTAVARRRWRGRTH